MGKNKKILLSVVLLALVVGFAFYFNIKDRVYWKYDDEWIIGKSEEEIIERYGEFDDYFLRFNTTKGYYINDFDDWGPDYPIYYYIDFNDDNEATKVSVGGPIGG
ncbi:MAG: hypothetical protein ACK5LZ_00225 [Anaerorhabdus sp.]